MLHITNNSIKHRSFVYTQLNDQTVLFLTIQFSVSYKVEWFQVLLYITNNSIKHRSFVYTQLNDQTVLFLTIRFDISHLFAHSLKWQTVLFDPLSGAITPSQSGPGSDGNEGVLRISQSSSITGTPSSDCLMSYRGHSLGWDSPPHLQICSRYNPLH